MEPVTLLVFVLVVLFTTKLYDRGRRAQRDLPVPGVPGVWLSYVKSISNCFRAKDAIQDACVKYGGRLFALSLLGKWVVLAKSKEHVRDLYNAPEDVLSMESAAEELLQLRHTVGEMFCDETYHIQAIRTSMNQNLADILPEMIDEMECSYKDIIHSQLSDGREWTPIDVLQSFSRIICRTSNRVFVGLPLCRDENYCKLAREFTGQALLAGPVLKFLVPAYLRTLAGSIVKMYYKHHPRILKCLKPLIEQRKQQRRSGETKSPNNMLSWLMDTLPQGQEYSDDSLAMRMLNVNFVALHTTTKTFTHALYHLAARPEYLPVLRSEAEEHLAIDEPSKWSKESLSRCVKLDSFFKETLRLNGLGAIWMPRLAVADFTFSDGTKVPAGYYVATAATAIHEDEANYERPQDFDGLRFANLRTHISKDAVNSVSENDWVQRVTGTSESYLAFGGGRHLCPGRFFASMEMKCLMAYLVLHFDVKMPQAGVRPPDEWFGPTSNPARNVRVLFRRRSL